MPNKKNIRRNFYLWLFLVCFFYWAMDSIWSYMSFESNLQIMIFKEPGSFLDTFFLKVSPYQIVSRLMVVCLFVTTGSLVLKFLVGKQAAEGAREEAYQTLLTLLNSIDIPIHVSDLNTRKILFMNKFVTDSLGSDHTGQICHEVFRKNKAPCTHCTTERLLDAAGNPKNLKDWEEFNPVTKRWYINHDRVVKWIDGNTAYMQIATDITQIKKLQEQKSRTEMKLVQAQKLEAIGTLAGGIAHDFNNILASVLGYTELLLEDVEKGTKVEDKLQGIYTAGNRAKDLVNQILTFARQTDEEIKPINVGRIAKEALKLLRASIPTTIEFRENLDSDALINGNPTQVHQIFMNLCTNAAHAMEADGGILKVSLTDIAFTEPEAIAHEILSPGNYLKIEVSDTGTGIEPEVLSSIFEPYFTTKSAGEGTGLGLAMVHGIVSGYRGVITVESDPGRGTAFFIFLPQAPKHEHRLKHQRFEAEGGNERILVVDDEQPIAEMMQQMLERLGYAATVRTSSLKALELFRLKPMNFDLVITDMTMPNMTGDKLAVALMEIRPDIPLVLCTGYSKKMSAERALELGIKAFVLKPLVKTEFTQIVRKVLDDAKSKIF
jgi:signal transduction histidine kinase/ActR/RegA family two-component response regulator